MRACLVSALMVLGVSQAKAQFGHWPGAVQNIELGYGWATTSADYIRHDRIAREGDGKVFEGNINKSVTSESGYSITGGTSIPLRRLGRISSLQLGADGVYNSFKWNYQTPVGANMVDTNLVYAYHDDSLYKGSTMNAGLALSLDFKFGVDAMRDKNLRWGWTGGIGVFPSISKSTLNPGEDDMLYGVQPFIKTEVSYRAGMVWKLRLMYAMSKVNYIDYSTKSFNYSNSTADVQLQGKGTFSVSLLILPFAFSYSQSEWYNER